EPRRLAVVLCMIQDFQFHGTESPCMTAIPPEPIRTGHRFAGLCELARLQVVGELRHNGFRHNRRTHVMALCPYCGNKLSFWKDRSSSICDACRERRKQECEANTQKLLAQANSL